MVKEPTDLVSITEIVKKSSRGRLVRFEPWHLDWLDFNDINGLGLAPVVSCEEAKMIAAHSISWTGMQDGCIVGCGGFTPLWKGVAELWLYLQPDAFKQKKLALKLLRHILNDIIKREKYHRVQAIVLEKYIVGIRFAEFFKFKNEGLMIEYTSNKENVYRYARTIG